MAEIRKVKIDKEFIVKIKGEVETDMTDEKIKWCFDTMDKELESIIREEIIEDSEISVEPVKHGEWKDCGEIEIGFKNNNPLCTDMCDSNGVIWRKVKVLHCPKCGKLIREYPQYVSSLNYCPRCGAKMEGDAN